MEKQEKPQRQVKIVSGFPGGQLHTQVAGQPGIPGAGRKPNFFKKHIQDLADGEVEIVVKGDLIGEDGARTGEKVQVAVTLPGALGVVVKAYKLAAKGDAQARKWLTETGWGKSLNIGLDSESPIEGGFAIILPPNER